MNDVQSLQNLVNKYEALKKQRPELTTKIQAVIDYNRAKIKSIQDSYAQKYFGDQLPPTQSTVQLSGDPSMANNHPLQKYLSQQKSMLSSKVKQLQTQFEKEAGQLENMMATANAGMVPNVGPKTLQSNMMNLPSQFRPGNLGDINRVVWPFWFTTSKVTLVPNSTAQGNITITQEAAFIWLSYTKTVYLEEVGVPGNYNFIDPEQPDSAGKSNNLTMSIRDSQSTRTFMNLSIDINQVGYWKYPTMLPTPQLILPNSNIEFQFSNNDQDNTYRPYITMFGLRVRIEDAKDILSTISSGY